eukprot:GHUV01047973.1.p1 GENE.GHUV01047973.1~~GHUV01047973.1.p1  ORF type:complete len:112 (-),score=33.74 GHUV01047973.1:26-361(-)
MLTCGLGGMLSSPCFGTHSLSTIAVISSAFSFLPLYTTPVAMCHSVLSPYKTVKVTHWLTAAGDELPSKLFKLHLVSAGRNFSAAASLQKASLQATEHAPAACCNAKTPVG